MAAGKKRGRKPRPIRFLPSVGAPQPSDAFLDYLAELVRREAKKKKRRRRSGGGF